jgi:4-diphosphocytidyl-2-C-methyl-D-erythritol kinase
VLTWRALAPGKVNLCLFLGATRVDGRHELVTVLQSLSLADELVLSTPPDADHDQVLCPGVKGPNLVAAALAGLRALGWDAPPVRIEVHKRVPVAAGMGGGSADAAAALRLAAALTPVAAAQLTALAGALGADVPSQLAPGLSLGTGAGEIVVPLAPLAEHALVILPQPVALATAAVYREADRLGLPRSADELAAVRSELVSELAAGAQLPARLLVNDLAPAAVSLCPPIAEALQAALGTGAQQALVCGSGPTVAGLFWGENGPARAGDAVRSLRERYPGAAAAVAVHAAPAEAVVV